MPAGVAAIQSRIASLESRFDTLAPAQHANPASPSGSPAVDFDQVLATARSRTSGGFAPDPLTATSHVEQHRHDHEMGPAGAPAELAAYGNGTIPASALAPIGQGSHRMWAPAAQAFRAMADAASRDGIHIAVSDSYRSLDEQTALAERKGIYGQGGLAAVPGTSNHGWGRALDIDTSGGTAEWLRANAARFGFHEDVPGEPWHWTYRP